MRASSDSAISSISTISFISFSPLDSTSSDSSRLDLLQDEATKLLHKEIIRLVDFSKVSEVLMTTDELPVTFDVDDLVRTSRMNRERGAAARSNQNNKIYIAHS